MCNGSVVLVVTCHSSKERMALRPLPLVLAMAWAARAAQLPGRTVGIDLGTTNSAVAIVRHGVACVVPNERGAYTTPSVVAFTGDGRTLTGEAALEQSVINARNTVHGAKRFIGRRYARVANLIPMAGVAVSEEEEIGPIWGTHWIRSFETSCRFT